MERWSTNEHIRDVAFGTLGTNLKDSALNRLQVEEWWQLIRKYLNKNTDWSPLFRVVEKGSKGGYLHIHFLYQNYVNQGWLKVQWARTTKIKDPHVDLRRVQKKHVNIVHTLWYTTKYVTKESSKYSWLGEFYGKYSRDKPDKDADAPEWRFWNIVEGIPETVPSTLDKGYIAESIQFNYGTNLWEVKYKYE